MNERQRKILKFLATKKPSEFITQEEISSNTKLELREVGSECAKLEAIQYVQHGDSQIGEKLKYRITLPGENQLDVENGMNVNKRLTIITVIATIVLAGVTTGLAIETYLLAVDSKHQTDLMQQDFDVNNRPWIGGDQFRIVHNFVLFDVKNFGNIPNKDGLVQFGVVKNGFTTEHLYGNSSKKMPLGVIMPSQEITITLSGDIMNAINETRRGNGTLFLGLEMNYAYGNQKNGTYGVVGEYNSEKNTFDILNTWVK